MLLLMIMRIVQTPFRHDEVQIKQQIYQLCEVDDDEDITDDEVDEVLYIKENTSQIVFIMMFILVGVVDIVVHDEVSDEIVILVI